MAESSKFLCNDLTA